MSIDWKKHLGAIGEDLASPSGPVKILIDLGVRSADEGCLRRLESYGVTVGEVVGNKVIGTIPGDRLADLRSDPDVADVEISAQLKPSGPSSDPEQLQEKPSADLASSPTEPRQD